MRFAVIGTGGIGGRYVPRFPSRERT